MAEYNHFEIERMLESMVVLVDTREQDTPALRRRLKAIQYPYERCKLDYGDYSCRFVSPAGEPISAAGKIAPRLGMVRRYRHQMSVLASAPDRQRLR